MVADAGIVWWFELFINFSRKGEWPELISFWILCLTSSLCLLAGFSPRKEFSPLN